MRRDHTGLLIIRAWIEQDSAEPLRAQLRLTTDVASGLEPPLNLTSEGRVSEVVLAWLAAVRADGTLDGASPAG
jgi:hypothetical protein